MAKEERILPRPWLDDEIELLKKLYADGLPPFVVPVNPATKFEY